MSRPKIAQLSRRGPRYVGLLLRLLLLGGVVHTPTSYGTPDPVLVGAGDIATCDSAADEATAALLDSIAGTIYTTGDNAYPLGTDADFRDCYAPAWGRLKARTLPSAGNHEYYTDAGRPYYDYFGAAAGPRDQGYYSYDLGAWHVVVLNSNIPIDSASDQIQWLRADLASNPTQCTVAYWHHPLFNSGNHGNHPYMRDAWHVLYEFGVDVVINGHDHNYERFASQDPDGRADPRGIREFIVGTGGGPPYPLKDIQPNSEIHNATTFGVLKFTLHPTSYDWEFIPVPGATFRDQGTATCVDGPPSPHAPTTSGLSPTTATVGGSDLNLQVNGTYFSKDSVVQWNGVNRPTQFVNSTQLVATIPGSALNTPGTASITVVDPQGQSPSNAQEFMIAEPINDNLLANGGFEDDADNNQQPDKWWNNEYVKRHTGVVYSGTASMQHYATNNSGYTISQTANNLTAGTTYTFSGRVNIPPSTPLQGAFDFVLMIKWRDANKQSIRTDTLHVFKQPTEGWQTISARLEAPAGTTNAQVQMVTDVLNAAVYVDELVLRVPTTQTASSSASPVASTASTANQDLATTPAAIFGDGPTPTPAPSITPVASATPESQTVANAATAPNSEPSPTALSMIAGAVDNDANSLAEVVDAAEPIASWLDLGYTVLGGVLLLVVVIQVIGLGYVVRIITKI